LIKIFQLSWETGSRNFVEVIHILGGTETKIQNIILEIMENEFAKTVMECVTL
jgi:hypothetical protein